MNQSVPDHKLELESQFIMRLPAKKADELREAIRTGEPLGKRLAVKFEPDIRTASVRFDDTELAARLYDLPTIIESYKTLDRKNFYKTADISQILICKEKDDDQEDDDALFAQLRGNGKREYAFPHGITPPLKNVRKRRFRKTLKKKYVDYSEIEKEVKRLLKFDSESIDSRFELVEENRLNKNPASPSDGGQPAPISTENSQNIDIHDLFGEESSSSDESSDDDDNDIENDDDDDDDNKDDDDLEMDNDRDDNNEDQDPDQDEEMEDIEQYSQAEPVADIAAEITAASDMISKNDDNEEQRQEILRELIKIKDRIQTQEIEMEGLDNQALRQRLQLVLDSLHDQENEIMRKLDDLG